MESSGGILLLVILGAVFGVLLIGVVSMLKGGAFNRKYGNKLMQLRVALQGAALVLLAILFLAG